MQTNWPWFERTFEFAFPPEKMPDILARLSGTLPRIRQLLDEVDSGKLHYRESPDTWSVQENVGHLADLESLWIGRISDIVNGLDVMRDADLTNRATFEAGHDSVPLANVMQEFSELRKQLIASIECLSPDQYGLTAQHPRLAKPMRIVDLCFFVAEHDDYHLARIGYLLNSA